MFRNENGVTLSGRVTLWRAAWPVALDAGPLGSGAGTVIPAYRRAGDPVFAPFMVDHLHSDPLEWLLEYGWGGALAGAAGAGFETGAAAGGATALGAGAGAGTATSAPCWSM